MLSSKILHKNGLKAQKLLANIDKRLLTQFNKPELKNTVLTKSTRKLASILLNINCISGTVCSRNMSKVIDVWAQPADRRLLKNVPEVHQLLIKSKSPLSNIPEDLEFGPEQTLDVLDHSEVDIAFMSAWSRPGKMCLSNEVIHEYTTAYPERFVGLGAVDLANPMKAVEEVEKCVKQYGFKGIRILPWLWNLPPNTNVYYPVYAKCVDLDIPVCIQVGHTGPMCPSDPGRPIPYLDQVALHFPDLKVVGGHIGYPWTNEMIALAWKYPNIYIDTSAYLPRYYPPELIHFMNTYGEDKIMFGTNWPMLPFDKCVKQAKDLSISEQAMEKFLWKNADRVFKLGLENQEVKSKI